MSTALEVIFDAIKADPGTTGATYMGEARDVEGLVREIKEGDARPDLTMGTVVAVEHQVIDIGVRGMPEDYMTPRNEALRLRYLVLSLRDYESRGLRLLAALPQGHLLPMGKDANRRWMFAVRFEVWMEPSI